MGRGRTRRVVVVAGLASAFVIGFALPAYAHHPILSGSTVCTNGDHVVTWTMGNSETNQEMTITTATAKVGSTDYGVSIDTNPVPDSGSTDATTIVPGNVTGTITLSVHASWPDGFQADDSTSVDLVEDCTPPTTTTTSTSTTTTSTSTTTTVPPTSTSTSTSTTTVPPTSTSTSTTTTTTPTTTTTVPPTTTTVEGTTIPPTSTTVEGTTTIATTTTTVPETSTTVEGTTTIATTTTTVPQTTSTLVGLGSTVPTTTTTAPAAATLPRTGNDTGFAALFGLSCVGAGALVLFRMGRRRWSRP